MTERLQEVIIMDEVIKAQIIEEYKKGKTAKELSLIFPYHNATISKMLRKEGVSRGRISKKRLDITNIVIKDFVESNMYCEDIAKKYNVDVHTVYRILDEAYIQRKSGYHSQCQENYFKTIDNPHKAYLLGFITADGAIVNDVLSIEVQKKDKDVLEFARNQINPNATLTMTRGCYRVAFSAKQLSYDLKKFGIVQNKSKILKNVPIDLISKHLLPYYFRGLIDGDGCIHKDGKISIYSGSEQFIKNVQQILCKEANLTQLNIYHGTTYFITWSSLQDKQKLFNYLYSNLNATYYYPRKYNRLKNIINANTEVSSSIAKGEETPQSVESE